MLQNKLIQGMGKVSGSRVILDHHHRTPPCPARGTFNTELGGVWSVYLVTHAKHWIFMPHVSKGVVELLILSWILAGCKRRVWLCEKA